MQRYRESMLAIRLETHSLLSVFRRFWQISLLLFATWLMAGPLALLQLGAWSWMLVSYSQDTSLKQAIKETFGDERPCDVCRVIDTAEQNQQSTTSELPNTKLKEIKLMLGLARPTTIAHISVTPLTYDEQTSRLLSVSQLVPTPPPRA